MRRLSALLPLLALGCGSSLSRAVDELESGRHARADEQFRAMAQDVGRLEPADGTRYALYRGLTHLALGDVARAEHWLSLAKYRSDRDLALLSAAERGRLLAAWRTMGRMPGE